jgi:hypothetical protein
MLYAFIVIAHFVLGAVTERALSESPSSASGPRALSAMIAGVVLKNNRRNA